MPSEDEKRQELVALSHELAEANSEVDKACNELDQRIAHRDAILVRLGMPPRTCLASNPLATRAERLLEESRKAYLVLVDEALAARDRERAALAEVARLRAVLEARDGKPGTPHVQ